MRAFHGSWFLCAAVLLLSLAGCDEEATPATRGGLPAISGTANCSSQPSAPAGCVWAHAADAVVFGTLANVSMVETGAVVALTGHEGELVDDCDGMIMPALDLTVEVEDVLVGDLGGATEVAVRIGRWPLDFFRPQPYRSASGELAWGDDGTAVASPLVRGQYIGIAVHRVTADGIWSLFGEPMFAPQETTGKIVFQRVLDGCTEPPTADFEGATFEEMSNSLEACDAESLALAAERKSSLVQFWTESPERYKAPVCIPEEDDTGDAECKISQQCDSGQTCVDGRCVDIK